MLWKAFLVLDQVHDRKLKLLQPDTFWPRRLVHFTLHPDSTHTPVWARIRFKHDVALLFVLFSQLGLTKIAVQSPTHSTPGDSCLNHNTFPSCESAEVKHVAAWTGEAALMSPFTCWPQVQTASQDAVRDAGFMASHLNGFQWLTFCWYLTGLPVFLAALQFNEFQREILNMACPSKMFILCYSITYSILLYPILFYSILFHPILFYYSNAYSGRVKLSSSKRAEAGWDRPFPWSNTSLQYFLSGLCRDTTRHQMRKKF